MASKHLSTNEPTHGSKYLVVTLQFSLDCMKGFFFFHCGVIVGVVKVNVTFDERCKWKGLFPVFLPRSFYASGKIEWGFSLSISRIEENDCRDWTVRVVGIKTEFLALLLANAKDVFGPICLQGKRYDGSLMPKSYWIISRKNKWI